MSRNEIDRAWQEPTESCFRLPPSRIRRLGHLLLTLGLLSGGQLSLAADEPAEKPADKKAAETPAEEPTEVGLIGIFPAEIPSDLSGDTFALLTGNWTDWGTETSAEVVRLYEEDLTVPQQKELLAGLSKRIETLDRCIDDPRYVSILDELIVIRGKLARRVSIGQAILATLETDLAAARANALNAAADAVTSAASELTTYLNSLKNGVGWQEYMHLKDLQERLAQRSEQPAAVDLLNQVHSKLKGKSELQQASQREFLAGKAFTKLEGAIDGYLALAAQPAGGPDLQKVRQMLADLVENLEAYESDQSSANAAAVRNAYTSIRDSLSGGAAQISLALRNHYFNYNVRVTATEEFLNQIAQQRRTDRGPVRDYILGANVYGNQVTNSVVGVDLVPSANTARFDITLNGTSVSNTAGVTSEATVYTQGTHYFNARKQIDFDGEKFTTQPARISVNANNNTFDANTRYSGGLLGGFANKVAMREAEKRRPESEAIAVDRVQRRVLPEFNSEVDKQFSEATTKIQNELNVKLRDAGLYPSAKTYHTTNDALIVNTRLMSVGELGGGLPTDALVEPKSLTIQIHESQLNNSVDRLQLAGKSMTESELINEIQSSLSDLLGRKIKLPSNSAEGEQSTDSFLFAESDPLRFRIEDGELIIVLRAGLKQEGKDEIPAQVITIPVSLAIDGDNLVVDRGTIGVSAVERPPSIALQITRAGVIRSKVEKALPQRNVDRKIVIKRPDNEGGNINMELANVKLLDGWLTLVIK